MICLQARLRAYMAEMHYRFLAPLGWRRLRKFQEHKEALQALAKLKSDHKKKAATHETAVAHLLDAKGMLDSTRKRLQEVLTSCDAVTKFETWQQTNASLTGNVQVIEAFFREHPQQQDVQEVIGPI